MPVRQLLSHCAIQFHFTRMLAIAGLRIIIPHCRRICDNDVKTVQNFKFWQTESKCDLVQVQILRLITKFYIAAKPDSLCDVARKHDLCCFLCLGSGLLL